VSFLLLISLIFHSFPYNADSSSRAENPKPAAAPREKKNAEKNPKKKQT
jgi:hypothetical protein